MAKQEPVYEIAGDVAKIVDDVKSGKYGKDDSDMERFRRMNPEDYRPKSLWDWLTGG